MIKGPPRVYLYRNPIITCRIPNDWIEEITEDAKKDGSEWITWTVARNIGERLFCSYYGLEVKHRVITDGINNYRVHTIPINDYTPKIGRHFECKAKQADSKKQVIHVFQTWYLPQIDIIGWIPNDNLPVVVREQHLNGINDCRPLSTRDVRNKYV
jgi:hypothetical protein